MRYFEQEDIQVVIEDRTAPLEGRAGAIAT
ncbi:hypothetical protein WG8_3857 [Paenibacillus sp. Aloe-11]|nr:hypothetical protein WG8_3857 [Paenibacillus sp. Aloe-11]